MSWADLTVAELRQVLSENDISFTGNLKKANYIELCKQNFDYVVLQKYLYRFGRSEQELDTPKQEELGKLLKNKKNTFSQPNTEGLHTSQFRQYNLANKHLNKKRLPTKTLSANEEQSNLNNHENQSIFEDMSSISPEETVSEYRKTRKSNRSSPVIRPTSLPRKPTHTLSHKTNAHVSDEYYAPNSFKTKGRYVSPSVKTKECNYISPTLDTKNCATLLKTATSDKEDESDDPVVIVKAGRFSVPSDDLVTPSRTVDRYRCSGEVASSVLSSSSKKSRDTHASCLDPASANSLKPLSNFPRIDPTGNLVHWKVRDPFTQSTASSAESNNSSSHFHPNHRFTTDSATKKQQPTYANKASLKPSCTPSTFTFSPETSSLKNQHHQVVK